MEAARPAGPVERKQVSRMKKSTARSKRGKSSEKKTSRRTKSAAQVEAQAPTEHRWTFLTNHAHILGIINVEPDLVLRQIAQRVGITERAVQRIIQELEEGGFLVRERVGRRNRYQVVSDQPLRHPIESHRNIGDLLSLIEPD